MKVLTTIADFRRAHATLGSASLGFVPTMGFLHDGHLEMIKRARAENDGVAVSIFVNPLQFAPTDDLEAYPRDFERDRSLLEQAGCDLLFHPDVVEIYPDGADLDVTVVPNRIASILEGASRPVHFTGVATVVAKLFNIVQAERAYFGQKDGQQVAVIKRMVRDLDIPVEIVVVPTIREDDGLAMSSRNSYLNAEQRAAAPVVFRALSSASDLFAAGGRHADSLRETMRGVLEAEPLANVDYVSIADNETLEEIIGIIDRDAMASLAVQIGPARLIDNLVLAAHRQSGL
jgi:pantoate--beta-alanine ligase